MVFYLADVLYWNVLYVVGGEVFTMVIYRNRGIHIPNELFQLI